MKYMLACMHTYYVPLCIYIHDACHKLGMAVLVYVQIPHKMMTIMGMPSQSKILGNKHASGYSVNYSDQSKNIVSY